VAAGRAGRAGVGRTRCWSSGAASGGARASRPGRTRGVSSAQDHYEMYLSALRRALRYISHRSSLHSHPTGRPGAGLASERRARPRWLARCAARPTRARPAPMSEWRTRPARLAHSAARSPGLVSRPAQRAEAPLDGPAGGKTPTSSAPQPQCAPRACPHRRSRPREAAERRGRAASARHSWPEAPPEPASQPGKREALPFAHRAQPGRCRAPPSVKMRCYAR
jgi:hypothetical protein